MVINWPATLEQIIMFISYCFETGYAPATIATYISGIGHKHKLHSWFDPSEQFLIKKMLEGCRRSKKRKDTRAPITPVILLRICNVLPRVCFTMYEAAMFKAAYLLCFFGLFRVSELVFTSVSQMDRPLRVGDISFPGPRSILISIRVSKANQSGPPTTIRIPCESDTALCPVCAIKAFLVLRSQVDGFLFVHHNGSPLKRSQFAGVLAKTIRFSAPTAGKFRTHSFRIGRASQLAAMGVAVEAIKRMGRWRSNACNGYIRL